MLKITILDSAAELCFRLEGKLSGAWVAELRQSWQTAMSTTVGRRTVCDLAEVDFVDEAGQDLLAAMHDAGVELKASTPLMSALVDEISGRQRCATVNQQASRSDALVRTYSS